MGSKLGRSGIEVAETVVVSMFRMGSRQFSELDRDMLAIAFNKPKGALC